MEYKWKTFSVTSVGSLMSAVDSTIVLLALVPIAEELKSDYVTMVWVVVAYILANTALVLSLGRLADIYGRKRMYNVGFVVFILGSALCGFAASGLALVGFRAIQGIGAALLAVNSFAILSEVFPGNERGKAFGANAIVWGSGVVVANNTRRSDHNVHELAFDFPNQFADRHLWNGLGIPNLEEIRPT